MKATKFLSSSSTLPPLHDYPLQVSSSPSSTRCRKTVPRKLPFMMAASRSSSGYRGDHHRYGSGRLVDEDMVVLRMRIREAKMLETRSEPPSNWMEWEKRYYANNGYDDHVCEAVGFLQNYLMNVRPGLALGLVALVALCVAMSTGVVLFHAIQIAHILLSSQDFLYIV